MRRRQFIAGTLLTGLMAAGSPLLAGVPEDFTVESPVDGKKFTLSKARGSWVVLHFLLKTECPFCLRHTREYARRASELKEATQVFLKPDSVEEIRAWAEPLKESGITVYRDADAKLAEAFSIPGGYRFHGQVVHYPALLILDATGKEVFRHVGKDNGDRFGFDALVAKLQELRK